ncbi:GNAT family N-acetyltransferase [Streptomyces sp. NPDC048290]|uniref:GNAT family N-acetyltransferase n=1 Tax=Streptomyces sp. NPDC048290 TaxID=3155811 RepID=UPI003434D8C1
MTATATRVREMRYEDCDRVAEIRTEGWRSAYRGLMPQPYLDGLSATEDAERQRARLTGPPATVVDLVAERDGEVLGWACHGPYRADTGTPSADAELYTLYVDPTRQGEGVGQALLRESLRRCVATGHPRMLLWVVEGNTRARHFYERAGFTPDGTREPYEVAGSQVPELRYTRTLRD